MKEEKYLSEAINLADFTIGKLNLIEAPCGSGKTTLAVNQLASLASHPSKVLYLIDTTAGREQIGKRDNVSCYGEETGEEIVIMTYAKFGTILKHEPEFADGFEVIIADEMHNLFWPIAAERTKVARKYPLLKSQEVNDFISKSCANYIALDKLSSCVVNEKTYVVGLSATPRAILQNFREVVNQVRADSELVAYETLNTIYYRNLEETINTLPPNTKGIVYINQISSIAKHLTIARKAGIRAQAIWSLSSKNYTMDEEQLAVREFILENQAIPDDIDILFINKAYETSLNIFTPLDAMVIHSTNQDSIIQARGRYRGDLKDLYCYTYETDGIEVPDTYLGTPLDTAKKKELRELLAIRNEKRIIVGWPTLKKRLAEAGYVISSKRIDNKRCDIITLAPCQVSN